MFRKLLLRGMEGAHLLLILYEIITFNAKKVPDSLLIFWEKNPVFLIFGTLELFDRLLFL